MKYVLVRKKAGVKIDESPYPLDKEVAERLLQIAKDAHDGFDYEIVEKH